MGVMTHVSLNPAMSAIMVTQKTRTLAMRFVETGLTSLNGNVMTEMPSIGMAVLSFAERKMVGHVLEELMQAQILVLKILEIAGE